MTSLYEAEGVLVEEGVAREKAIGGAPARES
jgi:hypothetical protein